MTSKLLAALLLSPLLLSAQPAGGERPSRPAPEEIAAELHLNHDADGDGRLSLDELTGALRELHANRPPRGERSGRSGAAGAAPSAGSAEKPRQPDHARAAAEILRMGDADGDRRLTSSELAAGLAAHHEARRAAKSAQPERSR